MLAFLSLVFSILAEHQAEKSKHTHTHEHTTIHSPSPPNHLYFQVCRLTTYVTSVAMLLSGVVLFIIGIYFVAVFTREVCSCLSHPARAPRPCSYPPADEAGGWSTASAVALCSASRLTNTRPSAVLQLPHNFINDPAAAPGNVEPVGRCGPLFNNIRCGGTGATAHPANAIYCNEEIGWCGNTEGHRNAQPSTAFDFVAQSANQSATAEPPSRFSKMPPYVYLPVVLGIFLMVAALIGTI